MPGDRGKAREHGGGEAHAASPGGSAGRAATVPAPVIEISGLSRRYGDRAARAGVDLTVAGGGGGVGLVGPNGAGTTTLL
ncbi:MAG: ABC transporter ATP-binding protein, partial [Planctomycetota bacterium]